MAFGKFWKSTSGNFAMMFSIALVPIILGVGIGLDYSRMLRAKSHLQDVADAASLSLASAKLDDDDEIREQAQNFVDANFDATILDSVTVEKVMHDDDSYDVTLKGEVPAYFMKIANFNQLGVDVSSMAVRGVTGSVEVALVLDNTWSMSAPDSKGAKKIDSLKDAAGSLVTQLYKDSKASVKVAVVPYADYVNVGLSHRNDGWVSVGADYSTTSTPPADCGVEKTRTVSYCKVPGPDKTCTSTNDGVTETHACSGDCLETGTKTETYTDSCDVHTTDFKWYGCVGSRTSGDLRLSDETPMAAYPGYLERWQTCLNPIVPLTTSKTTVQDAISDMIVNIGGYKPDTYIPAGLIWGLNTLSPKAPFSEGKAYDPASKNPRKVIVLMTDGENTLRFSSSDGRHNTFGGNSAAQQAQAAQTRADTLAICQNVKDDKIEIFSVAFAVDSADSKSLLQTCATDSSHYFDATDSTALSLAFSQIAGALTQVRLAR